MKIPSVPPRREPLRVTSLADLRRYRKARMSAQFSSSRFVSELTYCHDCVLVSCSFSGETFCRKVSFEKASILLDDSLPNGAFYFAVRGASKEF